MSGDGKIRSLGRFLYTQNPFYLISCGLILYGLQIARHSYGDLVSQSMFLTVGISSYTILMAITAIAVIRLGKVWEDARSILLVVVIGQFALPTGLDELCNWDWKQGGILLAASAVSAFLITEIVLRLCRMRLPGWYRCSYFALLAVFYATPTLLGYAVAERHTRLSNWGAPLFSLLIGFALLLLVPAVRQGQRLLRNNGTPWRWPLYPLSAFVIVIVLAGIRTHAVWMSFGFIGAAARFEPFLLLPILFALLVLLAESDAMSAKPLRCYYALGMAPVMLACGTSRGGMSYLPIEYDLQLYFGSALTISLVSLVAFYSYLLARKIPGAVHALVASIVALALLGKMPEIAATEGVRHWMIALVACFLYFLHCLRNYRSDIRWLAFAASTCLTIAMTGEAYQQERIAAISAFAVATLAMMAIGGCFHTKLARVLRHIAAVNLLIASVVLLLWHTRQPQGVLVLAILGLICVTTVLYFQLIKRLGWLFVIGTQAACLLASLVVDGYHAGTFSGANLPIQSGLLCFVIGVTISSVKTGVCRRFLQSRPESSHRRVYLRGL